MAVDRCCAWLIPSLTSLSSVAAYCRGDVRTYRVHYIVTAPACHPSKVLTLLLFLLVQHASCKLREGAVRSAYCSEVVRHGGSLYQSEGEWLHFMEEWKNGREEKKSSGGRASARTAYI